MKNKSSRNLKWNQQKERRRKRREEKKKTRRRRCGERFKWRGEKRQAFLFGWILGWRLEFGMGFGCVEHWFALGEGSAEIGTDEKREKDWNRRGKRALLVNKRYHYNARTGYDSGQRTRIEKAIDWIRLCFFAFGNAPFTPECNNAFYSCFDFFSFLCVYF